jgi:hypothetical protein
MKIAPVKQYAKPGFPTHQILDKHPELLNVIPERWRANPVVLAALTGLCLLMSSHRSGAADNATPGTAAKVAPIFLHGDGRGSNGCTAVNPPAFLSEAEAYAVISEEAKRAGISFTSDNRVLEGVAVPITDYGVRLPEDEVSADAQRPSDGMYPVDKWITVIDAQCRVSHYPRPARAEEGATRTAPLALDGADSKRKIYYEFVSQSDYSNWMGKGGRSSTFLSYDIVSTAKVLRAGLEKAQHAGTYAVFHDPCVGEMDVPKKAGYQATDDARTTAIRDLSRQELRKQVQDFIKWLKAEGII